MVRKYSHRISRGALWALACVCCGSAAAAVVTDGSVGPARPLAGPNYQIGADLGQQVGHNLFHSFSQFGLTSSESATFSGPGSIANIIGRVTGGSPSLIDGTLQSTIPGASLYLINPAGMMFGPHAALDVQGSFYAASADQIAFKDGTRFSARPGDGSSFTSAEPSAFGFLPGNSGRLEVSGSTLAVPVGRTLMLAGGDVRVQGPDARLAAEDGTLILAAAGAGDLALDGKSPGGSGGQLSLTGGVILDATRSHGGGAIYIRGGDIYVTETEGYAQMHDAAQQASITIAAENSLTLEKSTFQSATNGVADAGRIELSARDLRVTDSSIDATSYGDGAAGTIAVTAGNFTAHNSSFSADAAGDGNAGNLSLHAERAVFADGSNFDAMTGGAGRGGNITVQVAGALEFSGRSPDDFRSGLYVNAHGSGNAGTIRVESGSLTMNDASIQAATTASGNGGVISVATGDMSLTADSTLSGVSVDSQGGAGGRIDVHAANLTLADGGRITTESYSYDHPGGAIRVDVRDTLSINGRGEPWASPGSDRVSTGIFSFGGDISVRAPVIVIENSGAISTRTWNDLAAGTLTVDTGRLSLLSGGQLNTDSMGSSVFGGAGGNITLHAGEWVHIDGESGGRRSGISNGTRSNGDAGVTLIETPELVIDHNGAIINATGIFGTGSAGHIVVHTGRLTVANDGIITSTSGGHGGSGGVAITASESVLIDNGAIVSFGSDEGVAGRITVVTPLLTLHGGRINTQTGTAHPGGSIELTVGDLLMTGGAEIHSEATSESYADAGNIVIAAGRVVVVDSFINTQAAHAGGGNIRIDAGSTQLIGSAQLTASVFGPPTSEGGNVTVSGGSLVMLDDSRITATATEGRGGHITVGTQVFLHDRAGLSELLDASSGTSGNDGVVEVNSPELDLSGALVGLPADYLDASHRLSERCGAARTQRVSSFVVKGRGGLPADPLGLAPERLRAGCAP